MKPKHFLLRVYSAKRDSDETEPDNPTVQAWEVRAKADLGTVQGLHASLHYQDVSPRNLPQLDSVIHVTIDDDLTTPPSEESTPPED